jgi:hypothetical protein
MNILQWFLVPLGASIGVFIIDTRITKKYLNIIVGLLFCLIGIFIGIGLSAILYTSIDLLCGLFNIVKYQIIDIIGNTILIIIYVFILTCLYLFGYNLNNNRLIK